MTSYRQILYHIIFRTKKGKKTIPILHQRKLFGYIMGIINNKGCHLYRINGIEDHIHILSDLHPCIALASYIRDIKATSSAWLKRQYEFPEFEGWAEGYAALTYSYRDKDKIIQYIKNQHAHHMKKSFEKELRKLLQE